MKDTFIPAFDVKFLIRLLLKHFIPAFISRARKKFARDRAYYYCSLEALLYNNIII